jgi:lipoprotein-releasing system ATP-binding protein
MFESAPSEHAASKNAAGGGLFRGTPAVSVSGVRKVYAMGEVQLEALAGVTFQVERGESVAIVGESGSGKSTLLHIIGALDSPTAGEVRVGGLDPFHGSDLQVSHFRNRHVGFVFQHSNLLPEFSAFENVLMPGLIAGRSLQELNARAEFLLKRVGLTKRMQHYPGQMSGGEQQRVAIARALINDPVLLLADEPSGNLDSANAANIHSLFAELNQDFKTTVVVVTHNQDFAQSLPRRIEMRDGRIVSDSRL